MHARTLVVSSLLGLFASIASSTPAAAQTPSPPDVVFEPLVTLAESERATHPDLAHAHAEAALRFAPTGSTLAGRAQAIVATTPAPATPPSDDVIWEPLVTAAESDAAAGRRDLALDRLSAVMRVLPPASTVATRARNMYAIVSGQAAPPAGGTPTAPPPGTDATQLAPPPTSSPPPPPPYGQQPYGQQPYGQPYVQPYGQPYGQQPYGMPYGNPNYTLPPPVHRDPNLRSVGELVTSMIFVGSFGGYVGGWLAFAAGADPATTPGAYYIVPVLTAAALVGGMFALDSINGGMRAGQPNAITGGLLVGLGIGLLTVGFIDNTPCIPTGPPYYGCTYGSRPDPLTNISTVGLGATLGLGAGILYAFAVKPRIGATLMTESAALWGLYFGGMVTLMDNNALRGSAQDGWIGPIAGTAIGAVVGAILGQTLRPTGGRVALLWAGFGAGALAGSLAPLALAGSGGDAGWTGVSLALGATAGLAIVAILTQNSANLRDEGDAPQAAPPVNLGAAPLANGGAIMTVSGAF